MHETSLQNHYEDDNGNGNHVVNQDMFLILMLSNQTRIPCACLVQIISADEPKDEVKYTKLIQYYFRNILNATHHSSSPSQMLTFFSEVPMVHDAMLS
jgi:hypothetical protein